jgi:hypothetical protein
VVEIAAEGFVLFLGPEWDVIPRRGEREEGDQGVACGESCANDNDQSRDDRCKWITMDPTAL